MEKGVNFKLIATQMVSTVSGTKNHALQHIKSPRKSHEGKVTFCVTFYSHFQLKWWFLF